MAVTPVGMCQSMSKRCFRWKQLTVEGVLEVCNRYGSAAIHSLGIGWDTACSDAVHIRVVHANISISLVDGYLRVSLTIEIE